MSFASIAQLALLALAALAVGAGGIPPAPFVVGAGVAGSLAVRGRGAHLVRLVTFLTGVALVVLCGVAVERVGLLALLWGAVLLALFVAWSLAQGGKPGAGGGGSLGFYGAAVMAFFLFGGFPDPWPAGLRFVSGCAAIALGLVGWGAPFPTRKLRRVQGGAEAISPRRAGGVALLTLFGLVAILVLAFVRPLPWAGEQIVLAGEKLRAMVPALERFGDWLSGKGASTAGDVADADPVAGGGDGLRRALPQRAQQELGHAAVLHVKIADRKQFEDFVGGQGYVRSAVLGRYIGDGWEAVETGGIFRDDAADGEADGKVRLARDRAGAIMHEVFLPAAGGAGLPAIQNPTAYHLGYLIETSPGSYEAELRGAVRYVVESAPLVWDRVARGGAVPALSPDAVLAAGAEGAFGDDLRALAERLFGGLRDPAAKLDAVRRHLHRECAYSTRIANPDGLPPMQNFLFGERVGWCEFFASAAVLLAREAGFPARMAFGYSGGTVFPDQQVVTYRESDAHAWAEVLVEGQGWVVFDTSPAGSGAARSPRAEAGVAAPDLAGYRAADSEPGGIPEAARRPREPLPAWLRWVALALVGGGVAVVAVKLLGSGEGGEGSAGRPARANPGVPPYLREFMQLCQDLGRPMSRGATLREAVCALDGAGVESADLQAVTEYHYGVRYEDAPRDRRREDGLRKSLRALRKGAV